MKITTSKLKSLIKESVRKALNEQAVEPEDFKNPEEAYKWAEKNGPSDDSRNAASEAPYYAYFYGKYVDKGPHEVTRKSVSRDPYFSFHYAKHVDKGPHELTRKGAARNQYHSLYYAEHIDKGPHEVTRKGVEGAYYYSLRYKRLFGEDNSSNPLNEQAVEPEDFDSPREALEWAKENGPSDESRKAASRHPQFAYWYAKNVDKAPHAVTRNGASLGPVFALLYAEDVDKGPHDVTRKGAARSAEFAYKYAERVDKGYHIDTFVGGQEDRKTKDLHYQLQYRKDFPNPKDKK